MSPRVKHRVMAAIHNEVERLHRMLMGAPIPERRYMGGYAEVIEDLCEGLLEMAPDQFTENIARLYLEWYRDGWWSSSDARWDDAVTAWRVEQEQMKQLG